MPIENMSGVESGLSRRSRGIQMHTAFHLKRTISMIYLRPTKLHVLSTIYATLLYLWPQVG